MNDDIVQPPNTFTVEHEHRPRLYLADGRPLVRTAGFTSPRAVQTSGTNPPLTKGGKRVGGRKPKC